MIVVAKNTETLDDLFCSKRCETNSVVSRFLVQVHQYTITFGQSTITDTRLGHVPYTLSKVAIGSMYFLRVHKLPISRNDIKLMFVHTDLKLMMRTRVEKVDPNPFFSCHRFDNFNFSLRRFTNLRIGVKFLLRLYLAAE